MKKTSLSVMITTCLILLTTSIVFAQTITERAEISMIINGQIVKNENTPIIINGRTLIPLRELVVNLGVQNDDEHIIWNGEAKSVTIIADATKIELEIDSNIGVINGVNYNLDAPAILYKNRTYIPARFVGEALSKDIAWDAKTNSIWVNNKSNDKMTLHLENKSKNITINCPTKYGTEFVKSESGMNGNIWSENYIISLFNTETSLADYFKNAVDIAYKYKLENSSQYSEVKLSDLKTITGDDGRKILYKKSNYINKGVLGTYVKEDVYAITDTGDGFSYCVEISGTSATVTEDMIKEFMHIKIYK